MQFIRNHITFLSNFGKIDPQTNFDVFQITLSRLGNFEKRQNRP